MWKSQRGSEPKRTKKVKMRRKLQKKQVGKRETEPKRKEEDTQKTIITSKFEKGDKTNPEGSQHPGTLAAFRPQGRRKQKDRHMDAGPAHQATSQSRRWDKTDNWLKGKWPTRRIPKLHASEGSRWRASTASIAPNLIHRSCGIVTSELLRSPPSPTLRSAKGRQAEGGRHVALRLPAPAPRSEAPGSSQPPALP